MQLDVTSSQLLVTDRDFKDPNFGDQLRETVFALLDLKVIPLFNENDAISTRRQPYEVCFLNFVSATRSLIDCHTSTFQS